MSQASQPSNVTHATQSSQPSNTTQALQASQPSKVGQTPQAHQDRTFSRLCRSVLRNVKLGILWNWWTRRQNEETPKIIIENGVSFVLSHTFFHLVTLSITVVISGLQIHGFFIGGTLEGWQNKYADSTKLLMLQVAAKAVELLVSASLTIVVADIVRTLLLNRSIPFGLLTAHFQFIEPSYVFTTSFIGSYKGFKRKIEFFILGLVLLTCCTIVTLVGPATAVLLIPTWRDMWYGGGTSYWLAGNPSALWPQDLTSEYIESVNCADPVPTHIWQQLVSSSGCFWAGYQSLLALYREEHQQHVENITISDGFQTRLLQRPLTVGQEPFAISSHAAVTNPTIDFGRYWVEAYQNVSNLASSYGHYQRNSGEMVFQVQSNLPLVRAKCSQYINFTSEEPYWEYPYLPLTGSSNLNYAIPKQPFINSTMISTSWVIPNGTLSFTNGTVADMNPSALINIQVPVGHSFNNWAAFMTCSIDARWVNSINVGMHFDADISDKYYVYGQIPPGWMDPKIKGQPVFPFTDGAPSTKISMDSDFLNNLTPPIPVSDSGNEDIPLGYSTLADIFAAMQLDNGHTDLVVVLPEIESVLATVIVDGLARVGYYLNGGDTTLSNWQNRVVDRYNTSFKAGSEWSHASLSGKGTTPFVPGHDASNSTKLQLDFYMGGYSYKADAPSYWVALALFYINAIIVLTHLIYRIIWKPQSGDAWKEMSSLLSLALTSRPPRGEEFENTCGGIDSKLTMSIPVGVRVIENVKTSEEQVQLLVGDDLEEVANEHVLPGVKYGAEGSI
jgi:hypothetical protein